TCRAFHVCANASEPMGSMSWYGPMVAEVVAGEGWGGAGIVGGLAFGPSPPGPGFGAARGPNVNESVTRTESLARSHVPRGSLRSHDRPSCAASRWTFRGLSLGAPLGCAPPRGARARPCGGRSRDERDARAEEGSAGALPRRSEAFRRGKVRRSARRVPE